MSLRTQFWFCVRIAIEMVGMVLEAVDDWAEEKYNESAWRDLGGEG